MLLRKLSIMVAVLVTFVLTSLYQPLAFLQALAQHDEPCQTFRQTGKTVCDPFLTYWQQHGGLPIFGYPISQPFPERSDLNGKTYTVQYFERAVFEQHPENKPPYDVLLSQLGRYRFQGKYPDKDPSEPYTDNLPRYPDAQNIQITHGNGGTEFNTTMTYVTAAKPDEILSFYKNVLLKDGWRLYDQGADYLSFAFILGPGDGGVQRLDVNVETISPVQTKVTVSFLAGG